MIHGSATFDDVHYCEATKSCTIEHCILEQKYGYKRHSILSLVFSTVAYQLMKTQAGYTASE